MVEEACVEGCRGGCVGAGDVDVAAGVRVGCVCAYAGVLAYAVCCFVEDLVVAEERIDYAAEHDRLCR